MQEHLLEVVKFALEKHYKYNDPYVDDMPSARHAAAAHRKDCVYCAAYELIRNREEADQKRLDEAEAAWRKGVKK